jgi:CHAD domain-containing protein
MELDYVKLKEIKPAIAGYIRESQILLRRADVPDDDAVHDIRVLMKKARALLKFVAPHLENGFNDRDIVALREVGRIMCSWREKSVQRKTLKEFKKKYPDIFSRLSQNEQINLILEKKENGSSEVPEEVKITLGKIEDLLSKTAYRIRFQNMKMIDPQVLLKELDLSYARVVDIYLNCRNDPKPKSLHEFRKKTKDFLYQLYVFKPLNPSIIKSLEKKLDTMGNNLGKFNDLTQIIKLLGYEYNPDAERSALDELIIKIRDAQDGYLSKVWPSAYQIFCPGQKLVNVLGFKLLVI